MATRLITNLLREQPDSPTRRSGRIEELQAQIEHLKPRLRIAVVFAGNKSDDGAVIHRTHNSRSWKSYEAVANDIADALRRIGFRHVHCMPEDMRLGERLQREQIHLAWLNTGGVQGYHPTCHASAMLEMLGIPYVGHDPLTAATLDNKHAFKRAVSSLGLPTAPFITWHPGRGPFDPTTNDRFLRVFGKYRGPFVVKPVAGRASLNVHYTETLDELPRAVGEIYQITENLVMIEPFLSGREFCVAVCGSITAHGGELEKQPDPFAFALLERVLQPGEKIFTSMDVKPITTDRIHMLDEVRDSNEIAELTSLAQSVFLELGLESIIRLDVRADADGRMHILEANPKPDLKAPSQNKTSLVCAGLAQIGMSYDDLILSLLADRIDLLLSQRRGSVSHLAALLE